ncbi:MAG: DNA methylase, partial [Clostridia bacterium]|nr:DNA methylase [Clostridia bacterium]
MERRYIAIDLKSFYASVECVSRKLDPLTTNLVVADESRTEKTICLAVSPSLKAYGISGRARLFEVVQKMKEVNAERLRKARRLGIPSFTSSSTDAPALAKDPSLEAAYIAAPPRMQLYEEISRRVFSIYMRYVSSEDIHVYSIDECFLDVTGYLKTYGLSAHDLAITMIRTVLKETGITATAGIGTNMYLAKVAMDIVAKHVPADRDGVRIAELDEKSYREQLWCHTPITDFWRVGRGTAATLASLGCRTMGDVARLSTKNEAVLYKAMGVNAELLIDHAWGWEPTLISDIKAYKPEETGISSGQVLSEPYDFDQAKLIVREMTELMAMDLVRKGVVTRKITLTVGYDRASLIPAEGGPMGAPRYLVARTGRPYRGEVKPDFYGRPAPKMAHGTGNIDRWTSSARRITAVMMDLYDRIIDPDLSVRRMYVAACNLIPEDQIPEEAPVQ